MTKHITKSNNGSISQNASGSIYNNPDPVNLLKALGVEIPLDNAMIFFQNAINNRVNELLEIESVVHFLNDKLKLDEQKVNIGDLKNIKKILEIYIYKDDETVRAIMSKIISTQKNTQEILSKLTKINEFTDLDLRVYYTTCNLITTSKDVYDSDKIESLFNEDIFKTLSKADSLEKFKILNLFVFEPYYAPSGESLGWNQMGMWNLKSNLVRFIEQDPAEGLKIRIINMFIKLTYVFLLIVLFLIAFRFPPIYSSIPVVFSGFSLGGLFLLVFLAALSGVGYINLETQFSNKRKEANYLISYYARNLAPLKISSLGHMVSELVRDRGF